jgi:predicted permease
MLRVLFRKQNIERELDGELQFHLEKQIEANLQAGLTPAEARRLALRDFGGLEKVKEECRETRAGNLLEQAWQDLRYAARVLRGSPGFTMVAVICLALGIGATTAIFSVVSAVLLRPLPFPQPDRLMMIFATSIKENREPFAFSVMGPDFKLWRNRNHTFEELAAYSGTSVSNMSGGGDPVRVRYAQVGAGFFDVLGVKPVRGRGFSEEDQGIGIPGVVEGRAGEKTAIISDRLWRAQFGADPDILGKNIRLNGEPFTIIGLMPAGFNFPDAADLWGPVRIMPDRSNAYLKVIGRLKGGIALQQAQAEMNVIASQIALESPKKIGAKIVPLHEQLVGRVRPTLLVFLGAVCLVLLIACANVANLLLARAVLRQREIAVRSALGAGRPRIIRQLLTESLVLAVIGGALGLLLSYLSLDLILAGAPARISNLADIRIDGLVLGFTLLISIATAVIFGFVPAVHASNAHLSEGLKESTRSTEGPARHRMRNVLVTAETALALVLLIGAGLLSATFLRLTRLEIGFQPDNALTMSVDLSPATYKTTSQARDYLDRALRGIRSVPGVRFAASTSAVPLGRGGLRPRGDFTIQGQAPQPGVSPAKLVISPDYFQAMGVPLRQGRLFTDQDTEQAPGAVIISESLAREIAPDGDSVGKLIDVGFGPTEWRQIVGVVGDTKQDFLVGDSFAIYQPYLQVTRLWQMSSLNFVVRVGGDAAAFTTDLRNALQDVDKGLPVYDIKPLGQLVSESVSDPRFYASLLSVFSLIALVLAGAGIYGLTSYTVTQRTHEIGIRVALGAGHGDIVGMIVRKGLVNTALGIIIGLSGAVAVTRLLDDFLYGVTPTDPWTFVTISSLLAVAGLLASYIPARKALQVDAMTALRQE